MGFDTGWSSSLAWKVRDIIVKCWIIKFKKLITCKDLKYKKNKKINDIQGFKKI